MIKYDYSTHDDCCDNEAIVNVLEIKQNLPPTVIINNITVTSIINTTPASINISSTTVMLGTTTIVGNLYIANNSYTDYNSTVGNNLYIGNNLTVNSNLVVVGDILINDDLFVNGDILLNTTTVASELNVLGQGHFNTSLTVLGNSIFNSPSTFNSSLHISGFTIISDNVTIKSNLNINNNLNIIGSSKFSSNSSFLSSLNISGNTVVEGSLSVNSNLNISGTSRFNNSSFLSSVYISGNTILNNNTTINSSLNIIDKLNVSGNSLVNNVTSVGNVYVSGSTILNKTTLLSTLLISGATTLNSNLNVGSNTNMAGNANIGGTLNVNSTSFFSGPSYFDSNAIFNSTSTFNKDVTINEAVKINLPTTITNKSALEVVGKTVLEGVDVKNNLLVSGTTTLLNNTIIGSSSSNTVIMNPTTINSNLMINNYLIASGNTSLLSELNVSGNALLKNNLYINNGLFVTGNSKFNNNLSINNLYVSSITPNIYFSNTITASSNLKEIIFDNNPLKDVAYVQEGNNTIRLINPLTSEFHSTSFTTLDNINSFTIHPSTNYSLGYAIHNTTISILDTYYVSTVGTINVGSLQNLKKMSVNPVKNVGYVSDQGTTVYRINLNNNSILSPNIILSENSNDIAFSNDGNKSFIVGTSKLFVYDFDSISKITELTVGNPTSIAINPDNTSSTKGYIINNTTVSVLDTVNNTVTSSLSILNTNLRNVIFSKDGNQSYITNNGNNSLTVINLNPFEISNVNINTLPSYLSISPIGNYVYTTHDSSPLISVINRNIEYNGTFAFNDGLIVDTILNVKSDMHVNGNITVSGSTDFNNITAKGSLQVANNSTFVSSLNIHNDLYVDNDLYVSNLSFLNNVVVGLGNNTDTSVILNINSTTKSVLFPRLTSDTINSLTPSKGMVCYDTTNNTLKLYNGTAWIDIGADKTGSSVITQSVTALSTFYISGFTTLNNNTSVLSTMNISGSTTLASDLNVLNDINANSNLIVNGNEESISLTTLSIRSLDPKISLTNISASSYIAKSPNNDKLYICGNDNKINVLSPVSGALLKTINFYTALTTLSGGTTLISDISSKKPIAVEFNPIPIYNYAYVLTSDTTGPYAFVIDTFNDVVTQSIRDDYNLIVKPNNLLFNPSGTFSYISNNDTGNKNYVKVTADDPKDPNNTPHVVVNTDDFIISQNQSAANTNLYNDNNILFSTANNNNIYVYTLNKSSVSTINNVVNTNKVKGYKIPTLNENYIYTINNSNNYVSVYQITTSSNLELDTFSYTSLGNINLSGQPIDVSFDLTNMKAYIPMNNDKLSIVNLNTRTVINDITFNGITDDFKACLNNKAKNYLINNDNLIIYDASFNNSYLLNMSSTTIFYAGTTMYSNLNISGATTLNSNLNVIGSLLVSNTTLLNSPTTVLSSLTVSGISILNGSSTHISSLNVSGTFTASSLSLLNGSVTIGSNLTVSGPSLLNGVSTVVSSLNVSGTFTASSLSLLNGSVTVGSNLTVSGPSLLNGISTVVSSLNVSGTFTASSLSLLNGTVTIGSNLTVSGPSLLNGVSSVVSSLNVSGTFTASSLSLLNGTVTIGSNLTVSGPSLLNGVSTVVSSLNVSGTFTASSLSLLNGTTTVGSNLTVSGPSLLNGVSTVVSSLNVSGITLLNNGVTISGITNLFSSINITGSANMYGGLSVTGLTLFNNGMTVTGGTTLVGGLSVTGLTLFNNGMTVTGGTTLVGGLSVTGLTLFNNGMRITGGTTLVGGLSVTGLTLFNNGMTVTGGTTLVGGLSVTGLTLFNNGMTVTGGTTLVGGLSVTGLTLFNNGMTVTGGTTLVGGLSVTGLTLFNNGMTVTGGTTLVGGLSVTGLTLFNNGMRITGGTTLVGGLSVTGLTLFNNGMTVTGGTTLVGGLSVTGLTLFNNGMTVTGGTTLVGGLSVTGLTLFNNGMTVTGGTTLVGGLSVTGLTLFNNGMTVTVGTGMNINVITTNSLIVSGPDTNSNGRIYYSPLHSKGVGTNSDFGIGFNYNTNAENANNNLRSGIQIKPNNDATWRTILDTDAYTSKGTNIKFYTYDQSQSANSRLGMTTRLEITNNTTATSLTAGTIQITGGLAVSDKIYCSGLNSLDASTMSSSLNVSGTLTALTNSVFQGRSTMNSYLLVNSGGAFKTNSYIVGLSVDGDATSGNDRIKFASLYTTGNNHQGIGFNYNTHAEGSNNLRSGIQIHSDSYDVDWQWRTIIETDAYGVSRGSNMWFYTYNQSQSANSRLGMVERMKITNNTTATSLTAGTVQITGGLAVSNKIYCSGVVSLSASTINSTLNISGNVTLNETPIYLRPDTNHGLRRASDGVSPNPAKFADIDPGGPVLFGYNGGMLGTTNGGEKEILRWDRTGGISSSLPIRSTSPGQVLNVYFQVLNLTGNVDKTNNGYIDFNSYTPVSNSSYISVDVVCPYNIGGWGTDTFISILYVGGSQVGKNRQYSTEQSGGGTRSGVLFPLMGVYTNTSTSAKTIRVSFETGSDDLITLYAYANAITVRVIEFAK